MRVPLAFFVLAATIALSSATRAQDCTSQSAGTVSCMSGVLCSCGLQRGGSITGVATGYRWDCGTLRPSCGDAADQPATIDPYNYPLPDSLDFSPTTNNMIQGDRNRIINGGNAPRPLFPSP